MLYKHLLLFSYVGTDLISFDNTSLQSILTNTLNQYPFSVYVQCYYSSDEKPTRTHEKYKARVPRSRFWKDGVEHKLAEELSELLAEGISSK